MSKLLSSSAHRAASAARLLSISPRKARRSWQSLVSSSQAAPTSLIVPTRGQVIATTSFWLRGKGANYSGKVEFSDDDAKKR